MTVSAESLLRATLPQDLVDAVLDSYKEVERNYVLGKWKPSQLDAGHFVEGVRRIIELRLTGSHTPIGTNLKPFGDQVLRSYENGHGDESYRILIPRVLKSIYGIRNKRGVGHLSGFSANEMDATLILYAVKWVLAEIVRLESGVTIEETQRLVEGIVERRMELIWRDGEIVRVLDPSLRAEDQILVLLYENSPQEAESLRGAIEYQNRSRFIGILKGLHRERFIEYQQAKGMCILTPTGLVAAEELLSDYQ